MRNCLFVLASLLSLVHGREYFIKKDQSDFVIDGKYLVGAHGGKNKEFWVCVDYEAVGEPYPESYGSRYPLEKCGGSPRTENNMYWYAIHGIWTSDDTLRIYFKSNFQLWPEINETKIMSSFFWTWRTISDEDTQFRAIQTHGITNYGEKRSDIDTLLLIGGGSVHVRGVKDGSTIHLRVKSESETGITLENVLETKYDSENHVFQTTETPLDSEEAVTELSIDSDLLLAEKKATDETLFEEVTSSPTQWHVVDNEPAVRRKNDEPFIFIQVPNFEDGVQSRPTQNIPFVDKKTLGDPVYDQSSEESRRYRLLAKFENEIAEEETTTVESTTQQTSDETNNNVEDTVEFKKLYESLVDVKDSRYDYQLLYTVAIGTALAFFCFFILIVLFRCYAWDKTNKVSSFPAQPQQQHVVYTIGGMSMGALPIKVATQ